MFGSAKPKALQPSGIHESVRRQTTSSSAESVPLLGGARGTGIELSPSDLEHDLFDASLKMIRTVERKFASGRFPVGSDTDRRSQEKPLELFDHFFNGTVAVPKHQQLILQRVESHRVVDLLGMFKKEKGSVLNIDTVMRSVPQRRKPKSDDEKPIVSMFRTDPFPSFPVSATNTIR